MNGLPDGLTLRTVNRIADIPAQEWDACSQWGNAGEDAANPFISHAFLDALEQSGSVGGRSGWQPMHLVAEAGGAILGVVPAYLKLHSQGEYVFDHGWAQAFEQAGGRYYPKLQISAPFTPATGRRLLARPGPNSAMVENALADGLRAVAQQLGLSSAHITFLTGREQAALGDAGWLVRQDIQFHWLNRGYASYDDFLGALASRKRKALKKERREATAAGIEIVHLTGAELTEAVWDDFFAFYIDTGSRKWGRPYLTRAFFSQVGATMADRIILVMARRAGRYIAGAINFLGADALYGRHWGCIEDHPFLHFEVCYHQAIDIAIRLGLPRVEAGAQGDHKLARGYEPVITRSAHWIAHPGLMRAVSDFLRRETAQIERARVQLAAESPFAEPRS
jgi:predicted N-acyltransferase